MSFNVAEAARLLEVTTSMICILCRRGTLAAKKDSTGRWVIPNDVLETYVLRQGFHRVAAIAKANKLHPETIRRWLREDKLKGKKEGHWIIEGELPGYDLRKSRIKHSKKRSKKK